MAEAMNEADPGWRQVQKAMEPFEVNPNTPQDRSIRTLFMLSMDGGGIYGLNAAIWLRKLAERNKYFMVNGQLRVMAGTSSGGINALLLARHEHPREALLRGDLERFWHQPGIFSNRNPMTRWASYFGLSSYFGTEDFLEVLEREFGDMRMGDLKHKVLISTYNWTGAKAYDFDPRALFHRERSPRETRAGQTQSHWRPKFFSKGVFEDADLQERVVDVAFAAAAVPGLRPLRGGLGDGASFGANPAVPAIAHMLDLWDKAFDLAWDFDRDPRWREELFHVARLRNTVALKSKDRDLAKTLCAAFQLDRMVVLTVGSGQALPAYAYANLDVGLDLHQRLPTNPFERIWDPPAAFALDAANTESEYICKRLLGSKRILRLDPDIMPTPTVLASMQALNPWMRQQILQQIYSANESAKASSAVDAAAGFLVDNIGHGHGWHADQPSTEVREAKLKAERWTPPTASPWPWLPA